MPQEVLTEVTKRTPIENRLGKGEDVALIVGFLASEEGRWVTGQCIGASGGFYMH